MFAPDLNAFVPILTEIRTLEASIEESELHKQNHHWNILRCRAEREKLEKEFEALTRKTPEPDSFSDWLEFENQYFSLKRFLDVVNSEILFRTSCFKYEFRQIGKKHKKLDFLYNLFYAQVQNFFSTKIKIFHREDTSQKIDIFFAKNREDLDDRKSGHGHAILDSTGKIVYYREIDQQLPLVDTGDKPARSTPYKSLPLSAPIYLI